MEKRGPGERERGEWCKTLGPQIAPRVLGLLHNGYVMEWLEPVCVYPGLLLEIEAALREHAWSRAWAGGRENLRWLSLLRERVLCPDPPLPPRPQWTELTHGDPTVSNAMRRPDSGELIIVDPLPQSQRPHVARRREADMARLIQSALGWETLMYGDQIVTYEPPAFWHRDEERRMALWWCGATAQRISIFGTPDTRVVEWCRRTAEICYDACRI